MSGPRFDSGRRYVPLFHVSEDESVTEQNPRVRPLWLVGQVPPPAPAWVILPARPAPAVTPEDAAQHSEHIGPTGAGKTPFLVSAEELAELGWKQPRPFWGPDAFADAPPPPLQLRPQPEPPEAA